MECLNYFCIYNKKEECMLKSIHIDNAGLCWDCIYPDLPPEMLERAKKELREKFAKMDGEDFSDEDDEEENNGQ